ncbi:hypothetical protein FOL47_006913 [Perkinsus chesapeaki]|uniref:Transmembrane protein 184C n=1 Tax=Perkinsus chesapeaki TaxID=330153 RepID=A0A7J6LNW8_PERCH|nr:hypothetical protein FOL47_006913 [Perkinsus chesapeaki]
MDGALTSESPAAPILPTENPLSSGSAFIMSYPAVLLSLGLMIVAWIVTIYNCFQHLLNYSREDLQMHIIRIVLVAPLYATGAFLAVCLTNVDLGVLLESVPEIWEAVVVYSFFCLILTYVGGEHNWIQSTQYTAPDGIQQPWPLNKCFRNIALTSEFLRGMKRCVLQFVVLKPVMTVTEIVMHIFGQSENLVWVIIREVAYNLSYSVALYALGLLYVSSRRHPSLKDKRPLAKFVSVKLVIFVTFWQQYIFDLIFSKDSQVVGIKWSAFVVCIEMAVFAVLLTSAFTWREFEFEWVEAAAAPAKEDDIELGQVESENSPQMQQLNVASASSTEERASLCNRVSPGFTDAPRDDDASTSGDGSPRVARSVSLDSQQHHQLPSHVTSLGSSSRILPTQADIRLALANAKRSLYPSDVALDTSRNWSARYQGHVLLETSQAFVGEEDEELEESSDDRQDGSPAAEASSSGSSSPARTEIPVPGKQQSQKS